MKTLKQDLKSIEEKNSVPFVNFCGHILRARLKKYTMENMIILHI